MIPLQIVDERLLGAVSLLRSTTRRAMANGMEEGFRFESDGHGRFLMSIDDAGDEPLLRSFSVARPPDFSRFVVFELYRICHVPPAAKTKGTPTFLGCPMKVPS